MGRIDIHMMDGSNHSELVGEVSANILAARRPFSDLIRPRKAGY